jgi:hypothetical protein
VFEEGVISRITEVDSSINRDAAVSLLQEWLITGLHAEEPAGSRLMTSASIPIQSSAALEAQLSDDSHKKRLLLNDRFAILCLLWFRKGLNNSNMIQAEQCSIDFKLRFGEQADCVKF